jgi:hypothetical protein
MDQLLQERMDEYAEKLPSGRLRWADLEEPYDPNTGDVEFSRTAPRPSVLQKEMKAPASLQKTFVKKQVWHEFVDETSGHTYYWNEETNESTWECPAELKYGVVSSAGIRI